MDGKPACIVLDLDGSLTGQAGLSRRLREEGAVLVPALDLGPRLRIVANRTALAELRKRIETTCPAIGRAAPLIFYGSGDFHHLAALFLEWVREPVNVLHFDNHPDWTGFPATWNCGAWVNRALENQTVLRVVTIGPSSDDFVRPQLQFANLDAVRSGRLEVHPWHAAPSRVWGRPVNGPGCQTQDGRIHWHALDGVDWAAFADDLDLRLPPGGFWVSLDKDVLTADEAVTNWDQGGMALKPVLALVQRLAGTRRLLGMDVCGDYSAPRFRDPFRWLLSAIDRPARPPVDAAQADTINDSTNQRILAAADAMAREGIWPT
ncbi:hypothetical protein [Niveispirillum sp.]|uniref:hypothetical protein n=1 Tax=Niveispirillum sp. TaxID=1917217 RepID=UPI0025DD5318|nr:hypothetical protein [Niveispirillum sp.]